MVLSQMKNRNGLPLVLLAITALCLCLGIAAIGLSVLPGLFPAGSTTPDRATVLVSLPTATVTVPGVETPTDLVTASPEPWDPNQPKILLMIRESGGGVDYAVYTGSGAEIRRLEAPEGTESLQPGDMSPAGSLLVLLPQKTAYAYSVTQGAPPAGLNFSVLDLSAGKVQTAIPLLTGPADLLADIRQRVVEPYDEKKWELLADPKKAYEEAMDQRVGLAWDDYLSGLGSHAWSPDGSQLAFTSQKKGATTALRIFDPRTGSIRTVVEKPMVFRTPRWSPDGNWILVHQFAIGNVMSGNWYAYSADGAQNVLITDTGDFVQWISATAIAHIRGDFTPQMFVYDLATQQDRLFFEEAIDQYAVVNDGGFAAIITSDPEGKKNLWYCPFAGGDRTLLDSIEVPSQAYLTDLRAAPPDQVFVGIEKIGTGEYAPESFWRYDSNSNKQLIGENGILFALSADGTLAAFYDLKQKSLILRAGTGGEQVIAMETPRQILWNPEADLLLVQLTGEIKILRAQGETEGSISLPTSAEEIAVGWIS
jgi:hypothetical protein